MGDDTRIIFGSGAAIQLPDGVTIEDVIEAAARLQQRKSDVSVSEEISPRVAEGRGMCVPLRRRDAS